MVNDSSVNKKDRQGRKDETRRVLLEAARRVFARDGILAATATQVAREADRAHGSVFVHFGSLDGLVSAVVEDFGSALARDLQDRYEAGATPATILGAHLEGLAAHEGFYTRLVIEGPLLPPEARLTLVGIQSTISHHLSPVFADLAPPGVSPAFLFNLWVGIVHRYLADREFFAPGASVLQTRGPELVAQFLNLLSISKGGNE
jgi:AcrR family transcriptional regulator